MYRGLQIILKFYVILNTILLNLRYDFMPLVIIYIFKYLYFLLFIYLFIIINVFNFILKNKTVFDFLNIK